MLFFLLHGFVRFWSRCSRWRRSRPKCRVTPPTRSRAPTCPPSPTTWSSPSTRWQPKSPTVSQNGPTQIYHGACLTITIPVINESYTRKLILKKFAWLSYSTIQLSEITYVPDPFSYGLCDSNIFMKIKDSSILKLYIYTLLLLSHYRGAQGGSCHVRGGGLRARDLRQVRRARRGGDSEGKTPIPKG